MEDDLKVKELDSPRRDSQDSGTIHEKHGSKKTDHPSDDQHSDTDSDQEIDDLLDRVPPDFALAEKHRDANRVKNISEDANARVFDDEKDF